MKRWIIASISLSALIAAGYYVSRPATKSTPPVEAEENAAASAIPAPRQNTEPPQTETRVPPPPPEIQQAPADAIPAAVPPPTPTPAVSAVKLAVDQDLDTLVSLQAGYQDRQEAWKRLIKIGRLDQAVTDLEKRVVEDPHSAGNVAALGEGYYKKAGQIEDVREQAIYAMKADQTLEAALNLDPSNWDARFTKAAGMSHWPPELNKGKEVIEQFLLLMEQQEAQAPQPEFAKTYVRLGEQYEKAGRPDYAAQIWQRGAALFPNSGSLKEKLAGQQR